MTKQCSPRTSGLKQRLRLEVVLARALAVSICLFAFSCCFTFESIATAATDSPAGATSSAELISVKPSKDSSVSNKGDAFKVSVDPGSAVTQKLSINNKSSDLKITISLVGVDSTVGAGDKVTFKDAQAGSSGKGSWVRFTPSAVQLNPGESREVPFTITVPTVEPSGPVTIGLGAIIEQTTSVSGGASASNFSRVTYVPAEVTILGAPAPQLSVLGARPTQKDGLDYLEVFFRNTGRSDATGAGRFDVPEMGVSGTFQLEKVASRTDHAQLIRWQPTRPLNERFGIALTVEYGPKSTSSWSGRIGLGDSQPTAPPIEPTDTPNTLDRGRNQAATTAPQPTTATKAKSKFNWLYVLIPIGVIAVCLLVWGIGWLLGPGLAQRKLKKAKRNGTPPPQLRPQYRNSQIRPRGVGEENIDLVVLSIRQLVNEVGELRAELDSQKSGSQSGTSEGVPKGTASESPRANNPTTAVGSPTSAGFDSHKPSSEAEQSVIQMAQLLQRIASSLDSKPTNTELADSHLIYPDTYSEPQTASIQQDSLGDATVEEAEKEFDVVETQGGVDSALDDERPVGEFEDIEIFENFETNEESENIEDFAHDADLESNQTNVELGTQTEPDSLIDQETYAGPDSLIDQETYAGLELLIGQESHAVPDFLIESDAIGPELTESANATETESEEVGRQLETEQVGEQQQAEDVGEQDDAAREAEVVARSLVDAPFEYDHEQILVARSIGHSWETISAALGMSASEAMTRFTLEEAKRRNLSRYEHRSTTLPSVSPVSPKEEPMLPVEMFFVGDKPPANRKALAEEAPLQATPLREDTQLRGVASTQEEAPLQGVASIQEEAPFAITELVAEESSLERDNSIAAVEPAVKEIVNEESVSKRPRTTVIEETVTVRRKVTKTSDGETEIEELGESPFLTTEEILDDLPAPVNRRKQFRIVRGAS